MALGKNHEQLLNEIINNYRDQVKILKDMVDSKESIISIYEDQQQSYDRYIAVLKNQIFELQQSLMRAL